MNAGLEERIWEYIEGTLSVREVERFEADLLDSEVSLAFTQALMLRELLRAIGPVEMPADLVATIEDLVLRDLSDANPATRRRWFQPSRGVLEGLSWAVRGPQSALSTSSGHARGAIAGIGSTRYALGPLADRGRRQAADARPAKRRSLWRRVLRLGK